jgi:hypothetical protein
MDRPSNKSIVRKVQRSSQGIRAFNQIGVMAVGILAFVLFLIGYLNYANFERSYLQLEQSRSAVLAEDLALSIRTGLDLGLKLQQMEQIPRRLEALLASERRMLWVLVFGARDRAAFAAPDWAGNDPRVLALARGDHGAKSGF